METHSGPPLFFVLGFGTVAIVVLAGFTLIVGRGLSQWRRDNAAPLVTVPALVVTKRPDTWGGSGESGAHTSYYVTFEVAGGERVELPVPATDYGQLAEGDRGNLTHQGTRFKTFERTRG